MSISHKGNRAWKQMSASRNPFQIAAQPPRVKGRRADRRRDRTCQASLRRPAGPRGIQNSFKAVAGNGGKELLFDAFSIGVGIYVPPDGELLRPDRSVVKSLRDVARAHLAKISEELIEQSSGIIKGNLGDPDPLSFDQIGSALDGILDQYRPPQAAGGPAKPLP